LLHRNFNTLQSSLESANQAAANKVYNHLVDNQTLLKEVNALRVEVKSLSSENDRLSAQLEYYASAGRRQQSRVSSAAPGSHSLENEISRRHSMISPERHYLDAIYDDDIPPEPETAQNPKALAATGNFDSSFSKGRPLLSLSQAELPRIPAMNDESPVDRNRKSAPQLFSAFPNRYENQQSNSSQRPTQANDSQSIDKKKSSNLGPSIQWASSQVIQPSSNASPAKISQKAAKSHASDKDRMNDIIDSLNKLDNADGNSIASRASKSESIGGLRSTISVVSSQKSADEKIAELINMNVQDLRQSTSHELPKKEERPSRGPNSNTPKLSKTTLILNKD
jgi:hypothetical protein